MGEKNNHKILAISNDKGWKSYSEKSESITIFENIPVVLEHLLQLENRERELNRLKDNLLKFIEKNDDKLSESIYSNLEDYTLNVFADSHYYYDIDNSYVDYISHSFDNGKINIIEIDKNHFDANITVNIDYEANATFSFYMKDSIDGGFVNMGLGRETVEINDEFDFLIRFDLNKNKEIQGFNILSPDSYFSVLEVDFGFVEPNYDYYD